MPSNAKMYLSARRGYFQEFSETARDFTVALVRWRLAMSLALHDIEARYRGSIIGPWWITLTMGVMVGGIGFNFAVIFHEPVATLLPYVAVGIVSWGFISSCITEGGDAFILGAAILRQTALPLPVFLLRTVFRNFINLGHHIVIIVVVFTYVGRFPGAAILWSIAGLLLTSINIFWVMILVSFIASRFRDVPQIIASLLQILFFLTPVFWRVNGELVKSPLVIYNPFYYALSEIRDPLIYGTVPIRAFELMAATAVVGWLCAILVYNNTRRRVVHFL